MGGVWRVLPLAAAVIAMSPAAATVSLVSIEAKSLTDERIGDSVNVKPGPTATSTSFASPYMASTSDQRDEYHFAQIRSSAAGAVRLNTLTDVDFLVRSSVNASSLPFQVGTHAIASASATYTFSVDTLSTILMNINTVPVSASPASYVTAYLYSVDEFGVPIEYLRTGVAAGHIMPSYALDPGTYTFLLTAYAEGGTPDNSRFAGLANVTTTVGASLTIDSPPAPVSEVPEPASWAMMVAGFGAVGAGLRRRRANIFARA